MRIFTKTIRTIGVTQFEAESLREMITEALRDGKSHEEPVSPSTFIKVEIGDYEYMPADQRRRMER